MNKKQLYNTIMRNISKEIKYALNEEILSFDVTEYEDNPSDMISTHEVNKFTYNYFPKDKQELASIIDLKIKENKFGNKNLYYPDLSDIDTSKINDMKYLFPKTNLKRIRKPVKLDLSTWNTSNVTDMNMLFEDCSSIVEIDMTGWDTSNVEDMGSMFHYCKSLQTVDLSGFDTSNVTNMSSMFSFCELLKSLDLSSFDTSNVTDMSNMFCYCTNLADLDISHFNMGNIEAYDDMFLYCQNLKNLKLFTISNEMLINAFNLYIGLKES